MRHPEASRTRRSRTRCAQYGKQYQRQARRRRSSWSRRRGAGHRRRARLRREPVQPRDRRRCASRARRSSRIVYLHRADDGQAEADEHRRRTRASASAIGARIITAARRLGNCRCVIGAAKSLNTVAVRLSVIIGQAYWKGKDANQWNFAKLGRAKISRTRTRWALRRRSPTPCRCRSAPAT